MAPSPSVLAEMGITKDDYQLLIEYIRADAAAHGGTCRTKRVIEALRATDHDFSEREVGYAADTIGVKREVGPETGKGKGGPGRPKNCRDVTVRRGRSDKGVPRVDATPEQAAAAYAATKSYRKAGDMLGVSYGTISNLLEAYRSKLPTDDK